MTGLRAHLHNEMADAFDQRFHLHQTPHRQRTRASQPWRKQSREGLRTPQLTFVSKLNPERARHVKSEEHVLLDSLHGNSVYPENRYANGCRTAYSVSRCFFRPNPIPPGANCSVFQQISSCWRDFVLLARMSYRGNSLSLARSLHWRYCAFLALLVHLARLSCVRNKASEYGEGLCGIYFPLLAVLPSS